jgi:hypothetical protein
MSCNCFSNWLIELPLLALAPPLVVALGVEETVETFITRLSFNLLFGTNGNCIGAIGGKFLDLSEDWPRPSALGFTVAPWLDPEPLLQPS